MGPGTTIGFIVKISLGDHFQMDVDFWETQSRWTYDESIKVVTCSFQDVGKYPHLHWRFNMSPQGWCAACRAATRRPRRAATYACSRCPRRARRPHRSCRSRRLPGGFAWFICALLPLFFYKPRGTAFVASLYGTLTYAVPKLVLPAEETMSMY